MKKCKLSVKEIIELFLIIIGLVLSAFIGFYQYKISDTQTKILNLSSAPREATIEIILREKINIQANFLIRPNDRAVFRTISILNFGTMDSNLVSCHNVNVDNYGFSAYIFNDTDSTIDANVIRNIPQGSSVIKMLRITYDLCDREPEICNKPESVLRAPELVPLGRHNITFNCECLGCKKQRNFNQTIDFCIYDKNQDEECNN